MRFYSDILQKFFDDADTLIAAEKEQVQKDKKEKLEKEKQEKEYKDAKAVADNYLQEYKEAKQKTYNIYMKYLEALEAARKLEPDEEKAEYSWLTSFIDNLFN